MMEFSAESLDVGYGDKIVGHNINIKQCKGKIVCLIGPNGAGKSTILKTLSGELAPLGGFVFLGSENIKNISNRDMAKKLSVVLTDKIEGGMMTAFDVVAMGRYPHTDFFGKLNEKDIQIIQDNLIRVHAEKLSHKFFSELSDGEKQKVLLARALCQEPQVIILDEPTSYLDIRHKIELIAILQNLVREKKLTVIMSLHEVDIAIKNSDIIIMVKNGKALLYKPSETEEDSRISELYELSDAGYNSIIGIFEIKNPYSSSVFVTGGNGTGTPVYRLLTKKHIGFSTGILLDNDIDYSIAKTIGVNIIGTSFCNRIEESIIKSAFDEINKVDRVIDSGFQIGELNSFNARLIVYAADAGKKIFTLRKRDAAERIFRETADKFIYCSDLLDLSNLLNL